VSDGTAASEPIATVLALLAHITRQQRLSHMTDSRFPQLTSDHYYDHYQIITRSGVILEYYNRSMRTILPEIIACYQCRLNEVHPGHHDNCDFQETPQCWYSPTLL